MKKVASMVGVGAMIIAFGFNSAMAQQDTGKTPQTTNAPATVRSVDTKTSTAPAMPVVSGTETKPGTVVKPEAKTEASAPAKLDTAKTADTVTEKAPAVKAAEEKKDVKADPTGKVSKTDRVEARIKDLHTKLKITPAQEGLWNNVTQVMRDNAKTMDALINARAEKASTMTAVEDFKSYAEITETHAEGLKKFIEVFEPFYASMSDAQKKNADTLFRHHGHKKSKAKVK